MKRRTYLATAGALALAGCMSSEDSDDPTNSSNDSDDGDDTEPDTGSDDGTDEPDDPEEDHTFDDFEDLANWEVLMGSMSVDDSQSYEGSQCALLEASESDGQVRISRTFSESVDCSDMMPGLAIATDMPVTPVIQLYDEDRGKAVYRQRLQGDLPFERINFGIDYMQEDPDLSEIVEVHIVLWTGDEAEGRMWVDDLHFVPRPETGKVMLQFPGAYESHHETVLPMLEEHDYPATAFVPTARIRDSSDHDGSRLTRDQLDDLADAGWLIGSQSLHGNSLTSLEGRSQEDELADSRAWLEDNGYDGAGYLSYPSGAYDGETLDLAREHYDLAFVGDYAPQGYVTNPVLCAQVSSPDADRARHVLDITAEFGGITALSYYQLESTDDFESMLSHLTELVEAGDLEVITPADVENEYVL
ncbi:polysaccharide deacetylase family protein [Natrononativus amylolyticus]|uniref:polysaccharide deacetylase family protein n=1 Tax=Natrononativus amylolyticus TaxID=2963434 RepID=UPI0020CFC79C|nr:polysaccharide deacetylase family protein [Natrononativus amylolyticus]